MMWGLLPSAQSHMLHGDCVADGDGLLAGQHSCRLLGEWRGWWLGAPDHPEPGKRSRADEAA